MSVEKDKVSLVLFPKQPFALFFFQFREAAKAKFESLGFRGAQQSYFGIGLD